MRKISPKKYAISLYELIQTADKEKIPALIRSFVALLARNKALSKADKIIKALGAYINEQEDRVEVSVVSVTPLDAHTKEHIVQLLKSALHKTVALKDTTDARLIGGLVLRYGDTVIDGSVKRRIELLAESLK